MPLSTFSTSAELRRLLGLADIELLLATPMFRGHDYVTALREAVPGIDEEPRYRTSAPALRGVAFSPAGIIDAGAGVDQAVLDAAEAGVRPSDRLVIIHTSGSTNEPKGVVHQHGPLLRAVLIRLGERDHILSLVVHHIASDGWSKTILSLIHI